MKSRLWVSLGLCLSLLGLGASHVKGPVTFTVDVPPVKWKALKVRNLPKGAVVGVNVRTSGEVAVSFVNAADYKRFPRIDRPLFQGRVEKRFSFSVTIPASGHYFVVFLNSSRAEPRVVTVTVRAAPGDWSGKAKEKRRALRRRPSDLVEAEKKLREFERKLNKIFIFEPFPIRAKKCGAPTAFAGSTGIVLCREYAQKLYGTLGDKAKAADALLFTVFHEVGHVLLKQWNYPFFDNEDVADEFATVVMIMLGQRERVRAKAEYFSANPSVAEAIAKAFRDDRHSLSAQRARNILRWLDDPQLVHNWQKVFVPHIQTTVLEKLQKTPTSWTDLALVEEELTARR